MDFDRLRYLAAVARTGSVRGAATALHVTPGAVSKGLTRLQEESGMQLLMPDGRGVALTDDGQWLAQRAEQLVGDFAALGSDLSNRRGRMSELCIATYDVFATWFPGLLARQYLPGVPLSVRERWPGEVEKFVASGVSDAGITFIPVATEGVEHVEVTRVPLAIYARRDTFADTQLERLPFVVASHPVTGAVGTYGPLDGWPADAPLRDVRYRVSSMEARLEICRQGQAAALLPDFVAALHNRLVHSKQRLERRSTGAHRLGKLSRRVYVVRRPATADIRRQHVDTLIEAVRAICNVTH